MFSNVVVRGAEVLARRRKRAWLVMSLITCLVAAACGSTGASGDGSDSPSGSGASDDQVVAKARSIVEQYQNIRVWPMPTKGPKGATGKNVWWISCGQASPGCAEATAQAQSAAKVLGWNMTVYDGKFGVNNAYTVGITQAIAAKADGIMLLGVQCGDVKQALTRAKAARIPVVTYQGEDCPGTQGLQTNVEFLPGHETAADFNYLVGQVLGHYLIAELNGKANVLYYNIIGDLGSNQEAKGLQEVIKQCSGCKYTQQDYPLNAVSPELASRVQADLISHQDANAVATPYASPFDIGLGSGIRRAGRKLLVASGSGSPAIYDSIRKQTNDVKIVALSNMVNSQGAWAVVDTLNRVFQNEPPVPGGGFIALTSLKHNLPTPGKNFVPDSVPDFFETRFDFVTAYTKIWTGRS